MLFLGSFRPALAGDATGIPGPRIDRPLVSGWHFVRQDVPAAERPAFDDSAWAPVSLPHTWNNLDGEEGSTNFYRGIGWYRLHCPANETLSGREIFLKFDGAFLVADVYVNGHCLGEHQGGFAAFTFDATPFWNFEADNLIAVKVNNAPNTNIPPLSADFTFFGGLYREVHLLALNPVHISPLDYGSPGVYLATTDVSSNSANLRVTTVLSNSLPRAQSALLRATVLDAAEHVVATLTNAVTLPPAKSSNVIMKTVLLQPHLWQGRADPYLYHVAVDVLRNGLTVDSVRQPLGFRWFRVDPDQGFFLNGQYLDLHGTSLHQDWLDRGWAIGSAERQANFALLMEIGATAVRLSHYEHHDETYQLADANGLCVWTEIPLVNRITESPQFYANAKQQLTEIIRQRGNHPSVICWGVFNEITLKHGPRPVRLAQQLVELAHQEDPTRPAVSAANAANTEPSNWCSDWNAFNKYFGWYDGAVGDFGPWATKVHSQYPNRPIGITEFGAGASPYQHQEDETRRPAPAGNFHPEEYQDFYHETHWQQMRSRPYLWCKFVWNLCDFAVAARNEGDTPGRNDKGLVTYDRRTRKDAFYFYQANWTTNPMVYITGHTFTNRLTNSITAKIYSNCDSVELFVNGRSQGRLPNTDCIFTWPVSLSAGANHVEAVGVRDNLRVSDALSWVAPSEAPGEAMNRSNREIGN